MIFLIIRLEDFRMKHEISFNRSALRRFGRSAPEDGIRDGIPQHVIGVELLFEAQELSHIEPRPSSSLFLKS